MALCGARCIVPVGSGQKILTFVEGRATDPRIQVDAYVIDAKQRLVHSGGDV